MTQQMTQYEPAPLAPIVTDDQIDLIKRTVAVGATDAELQLYLYDCQRHGVHPLDKLLHFTKRQGKYTPITSIDLLRSRAADTGELAGIDDAEFAGELATALFAARVTVYRMVQGIRCPFTATARWSEYKPDQDFMWKRMPHTMLAKCAEALALRRAFPRQLAGLYAREEMSQAEAMPARTLVSPPAPETVTIEGVTANVKAWYTDGGAGRLGFTLGDFALGDTLVIASDKLAETWFDLENGETLLVEGVWCKHPQKGAYIGASAILRKPEAAGVATEPAGHVSDIEELPF